MALLGGGKYHVGKRDSGSGIGKFDVAYFAACVDDVDTVKRFAKELKLDFPVLADSDKTVAKAYGVLSDRGFANRWTFYIGKDGVIQFIDQKVTAKDHGKDVAKKLEELGVPKK